MAVDLNGTRAEWGMAIGRDKSRMDRKLQKLKQFKLAEERLGGKRRVKPEGVKEPRA
jgi:hypothetical protein